ncbi:MAG TPA: tetratricopeptide repeat protein [Thiobacillaceae bacterium]|nr:tetratricopeptide repeat protein [Thiobacillaceae bacterium]
MSLSPYVLDATAENFPTLVLENSRRGLVLVHFWTPKAGPCMVLMPRLVKLAAEYAGKFLLVMFNTDELGALARRIGVTSVPTVKFFRHGEIVHTIHGAEPDSTFRQALKEFIADDAERAYSKGLAAWRAGNLEQARQLLAQAALDSPDNPAIPRDLAKILWAAGEQEQALNLLRSLPSPLKMQPEIEALLSHFLLAHTAQTAPEIASLENLLEDEPDNLTARYQLAARLLGADEVKRALDELLNIVNQNVAWQGGQAHKSLLHLLDWLGPDHPLVPRYRQALASTLH